MNATAKRSEEGENSVGQYSRATALSVKCTAVDIRENLRFNGWAMALANNSDSEYHYL